MIIILANNIIECLVLIVFASYSFRKFLIHLSWFFSSQIIRVKKIKKIINDITNILTEFDEQQAILFLKICGVVIMALEVCLLSASLTLINNVANEYSVLILLTWLVNIYCIKQSMDDNFEFVSLIPTVSVLEPNSPRLKFIYNNDKICILHVIACLINITFSILCLIKLY